VEESREAASIGEMPAKLMEPADGHTVVGQLIERGHGEVERRLDGASSAPIDYLHPDAAETWETGLDELAADGVEVGVSLLRCGGRKAVEHLEGHGYDEIRFGVGPSAGAEANAVVGSITAGVDDGLAELSAVVRTGWGGISLGLRGAGGCGSWSGSGSMMSRRRLVSAGCVRVRGRDRSGGRARD